MPILIIWLSKCAYISFCFYFCFALDSAFFCYLNRSFISALCCAKSATCDPVQGNPYHVIFRISFSFKLLLSTQVPLPSCWHVSHSLRLNFIYSFCPKALSYSLSLTLFCTDYFSIWLSFFWELSLVFSLLII